jgi:hypothetical protein
MNIFIINGVSGAGKDTFVECYRNIAISYDVEVFEHHSSELAKECLTKLGWSGERTPEVRKMLADLVTFSNTAFNTNLKHYKQLIEKYTRFYKQPVMFIHERETENIDLFKKVFSKYVDILGKPFLNVKTVLIRNKKAEQEVSLRFGKPTPVELDIKENRAF